MTLTTSSQVSNVPGPAAGVETIGARGMLQVQRRTRWLRANRWASATSSGPWPREVASARFPATRSKCRVSRRQSLETLPS